MTQTVEAVYDGAVLRPETALGLSTPPGVECLTGVANAQTITIRLFNISDGTKTGDLVIPMSVLLGDTNSNGSVTAADIGQTKAQSGQAATGANFRTDVNVSGSITAADIGLVKSSAGTGLP